MLIEGKSEIDGKIAIIIQGPFVLENHFTLETIRLYGKLFPSAKVILSTWETEDARELSLIGQEQNCIVLRNTPPDDPGVINVNYQCKSTINGIICAEELGYKYVAKTRSDWRMYEKGILRFMMHMLDNFPCNSTQIQQNKRIIVMDTCSGEISTIFYPYYYSDIFLFGDIEDMKNYWSHSASRQDDQGGTRWHYTEQ